MSIPRVGNFVIRSMTALVGVLAIGCGASNPTSPSSSVAASGGSAPTAPTAASASVTHVLPAALLPSASPQTLLVEGKNFKPGLTVDFVFTPAGSTQSVGAHVKSAGGSTIRNLTDTTFELDVTVNEVGTYNLRVTNPDAPPSDAVSVSTEPTEAPRPVVQTVTPASPTANPAAQTLTIGGHDFAPGL